MYIFTRESISAQVESTLATVSSSGRVDTVQALVVTTRCGSTSSVKWFPFDEYSCPVVIGRWPGEAGQFNPFWQKGVTTGMDIRRRIPVDDSGEWHLLGKFYS